jgi:hypothetical protein
MREIKKNLVVNLLRFFVLFVRLNSPSHDEEKMEALLLFYFFLSLS